MKPINGKCEIPEQKLERGVITIASQRTGYNCKEASPEENIEELKSKNEDGTDTQPLKRLKKGLKR